MSFFKKNFILLLILFLGFFLRTYQLGQNPFGLFCDEASIGYDAYSLSKTGTDEWGAKWPLFFKAFGEYKSPIMTYSTIPFVAILGLSDFSVRLVSALFGVAGIFAIYFLATTLFNKNIGLISALFLTISPWHIHFSRVSLEGLMPYVCFTVLGISYWFIYLKKHQFKLAFLSTLFFVLAIYSYFPARIFVPLLGFVIIVFSIKTLLKNKTHFLYLIFITLILISPLFYHMFFGPGLARWEAVKGNNNLITIIQKYTDYFSFDYLFSKGDIDFRGQFITRHSLRGIGQLYLFQLPLIFFGLIELFCNRQSKFIATIIIFWLLFYPIPDLLTASNSPYATRSIIGVIPFQILSALGLKFLFKIFTNFKLRAILGFFFAIIISFSFINYLFLFQKYPQYSSDYWGWQSGPEEIMKYFIANQSLYDRLCLEGAFNSPNIFIKFYDPTNLCHNKCQICSPESLEFQRQLFAITPDSYAKLSLVSKKFEIVKTIKYPNLTPAFYIGHY
jgi:4-amino-4-deoxy-L-arabinose transferase-like glycosyltransferase